MRRAWPVLIVCCTPAPLERTVTLAPPTVAAAATATATAPASASASASVAVAAPDAGPRFYDVFHFSFEIAFEFPIGSAQLPPDAQPGFDLVVASLAEWPRKIHVNGDVMKGESPALALLRAKAVAAELAKRGAKDVVVETRVHEGMHVVKLFEEPDLGPFTSPQPLYEACCRNIASTSLDLTIDTQRADSKLGREMYADAEARCKTCSGRWGAHGMLGYPGCECKFNDGGKACSKPSDCKGRCDLGWEGAMQKHGITCAKGSPCPLQGTCEEYDAPFGCHGWIAEDQSGTLGTKWICVD